MAVNKALPTGVLDLTLDELEKFVTCFMTNADSGCWEWQLPLTHGYGRYRINSRYVRAHRAMKELVLGQVIDGEMVIDHLCRNRACVNPHHLEVVTPRVNALRGISPTAINARKTHCDRGHELTPENTYLRGNERWCLVCKKLRAARHRQSDAYRKWKEENIEKHRMHKRTYARKRFDVKPENYYKKQLTQLNKKEGE